MRSHTRPCKATATLPGTKDCCTTFRVDHRHNYAMHWFWIYLARARGSANMSLVGRVLLLPQLVLLVYTSLGQAPHNLTLALFVQTFIFVVYNKVITA
jgi:GPI mannosyltransferase 1 subunit M